MILLRQSTAVTVSFGPFVLNTDGVTYVTNLTGTGSNQTENTSTGIRISKNGGAFAARHATAGASNYDAFGHYLVPLDTTDTGTLGVLRMTFGNAAAFCPVWEDYEVINTALWDALFASSGGAIPNVAAGASTGLPLSVDASGRVDVLKINGTSQTARDLGASVLLSAGSGAGQLDFTNGVVKANIAQILGTALTETAGQLAAAFKKFFNIATPAATMDHLVLVDTVTTYTGNNVQTGDTYAALTGAQAEPGQGAPAVNASVLSKISYLFKAWRNRHTQTATEYDLYADNTTTVDQKATVSDNGTTFDRGEIGSGP